MNFSDCPWLEWALLTSILGFIVVWFVRASMPWAVAACAATLVLTFFEWLCHQADWVQTPGTRQVTWLAVDTFSAPLLPLVALLHLLTALATPTSVGTRGFFARLMASLAFQLATFGCNEPWLLILFLAVGTLPPLMELLARQRDLPLEPLRWLHSRSFAIHMALFIFLLATGYAVVQAGRPIIGGAMLLTAILIRCGTVPVHTWVSILFESGRYGTAILFIAPLVGVYAAVRLVLPTADLFVLRGLGAFSLLTAIASAGLAVVQRDTRRMFAHLLLSYSTLILIGLEIRSEVGLTGAFALWVSVSLSLTGLGLVLQAVEARFGRLTLGEYRGLYDQSPALAAGFLLMGLGSVGFPGTLGFISGELLFDGAVTENPLIGLVVVAAGLLNSITVLRVYFLLFTGTRHRSAVPLGITPRERLVVAVLSLLILGGGLYPQPGIVSRYRAARDVLATRPDRDRPTNAH